MAVAGGCSRRRVDGLPVVVVEGADAERALRALGDALRGVAYPETPTELQPLEAVLSVVARQGAPGSDVLDSSRRGDWPPLARMFAFNEPITIELFEEVVGSVGLVALQRLGLVSRDGGCVRAQVRAQRVGERFVLSDLLSRADAPDYVPGVSNAARMLGFLTPRRAVGRVLDLGTGSGFQALLAANHAFEIVATDLGEQAVAIARATMLLNGVTNVEVRHGSWFEPVAREEFDLVVCNPPFVVSPERRLLYRDGPPDGDNRGAEVLCGALIEQVPESLTPGGIGVILTNWGRRGNEDWSAAPRRWLEHAEVRGAVIKYQSLTPEEYALMWNVTSSNPAALESTVQSWLEYYERLGIEELCFGTVALRRPTGETRARPARVDLVFEHDGRPGDRAGEQLARILEGSAWSDSHDTSAVLRTVPRLVEGHEGVQRLRFTEGRYLAEPVSFAFPSGAGVVATLDPRWLPFVLSIDGRTSVAELISTHQPGPDGSPERAAGAAVIRTLACAGLVELPATG